MDSYFVTELHFAFCNSSDRHNFHLQYVKIIDVIYEFNHILKYTVEV